jgi:hypothetical protein
MQHPTKEDYEKEFAIIYGLNRLPAEKKEEPLIDRKQTEGKVRWPLISFPALEPLVQALEVGMAKENPYPEFAWKEGVKYKQDILASIMRHCMEMIEGNEDDKDGFTHIGAIMANAMFYSHHKTRGTLLEGFKPRK